jgi:HSP20 family protein
MGVMRFDPFRDIDRLTEQLLASGTRGAPRSFPMDAVRRGDQFLVYFDLPGVDPASIDLVAEQNTLTVRAERRFEQKEGDDVIVTERPQGTFTRQLMLGDNLDTERIEASYDDGVLSVRIPVAESAKPRKIQVGTRGSGPDVIEARQGEG